MATCKVPSKKSVEFSDFTAYSGRVGEGFVTISDTAAITDRMDA